MAKRISSFRQAGQLVERSPSTVEAWVRSGRLPAGPWTPRQLQAASAGAAATGTPSGITSAHGTTTRWRSGCPCDECNAAHLAELRETRRQKSMDRLTLHRARVLDILSSGGTFTEVQAQTGLTPQFLSGVARTNPQWRADMDEALMVGRDPDLDHGTPGAWRAGCRCPECRVEHEASRH